MRLGARVDPRSLSWAVLVGLACAGAGVLSGINPALGLAVTLGLAFAVAVIANLTLGVAMFTILSFLEVINTGGAALSFMKAAGLLLFVSWFAIAATRAGHTPSLLTQQPVLVAGAVALVAWSAMSVAWAQSSGAAVTGTERYLLNILLLPIVFAAIRRREDVMWIVGAFVLGAAASAVYGLVESAGGRLTGSFGDPNEQAAVLVVAIMLAIGLGGSLRPGSPARFFVFASAAICTFGLVNTVSRGGLIALGCALLAGVIFGGRWRGRALLLTIVGVLAVGGYFGFVAPLAARQHFSSGNSTGRTDLWKVGWKMFGANPIGGVGSNNFQVAAVRYVQQAGSLTRADLIVDVPHVTHNQYLDVLDELGLPGLAALLVVLGSAIAAAAVAAKRYEQAGDARFELLSRMLVLGLVGILASDVFLSGQYSKQLWLLIALAGPLLALAPAKTR